VNQPDARDIAFDVLRSVDERDAYANLELSRLLRTARLEPRDAAFATELVSGTIRRRASYDAIIDTVAKQGVEKLDPVVLDALRLGAHQLLSMRVADHAAVSTTVELVRRRIGHKTVGFTNAILRKVAAKTFDEWLDEVTGGLDADEALAVRYSHPLWVVVALREALDDPEQLEALLAADNAAPLVTLVARPGLCDVDEIPGTPGRLSPYARILPAGDPGAIAAVRDGRAAVQDEGSQLVALTSAAAELDGYDTNWLDLCAGPGGKAALLAALAAQRGATLVANELQPHRAELVRPSVRRVRNVEVTEFDGREGPWDEGSFDRVLLDAPCTGIGALRRRPEARWRRTIGDVEQLAQLQRQLLRRAVALTRPGGVVAYATCSPLRAETTDVVGEIVAEQPVDLVSENRWWPHLHGTDAMYVAILKVT
jgi:16S rRNA (cytosine967-C5)-methyltransferase